MVTSPEHVPLAIVGVNRDLIGPPRNDGSPYSGTYSVPVKLNRAPSSEEEHLLRSAWTDPTVLTAKGCPLSVHGASVVLQDTTIDEVAEHHARTLARVVREVNDAVADRLRQREAERRIAQEGDAAHRRHVEEVASRIKFE